MNNFFQIIVEKELPKSVIRDAVAGAFRIGPESVLVDWEREVLPGLEDAAFWNAARILCSVYRVKGDFALFLDVVSRDDALLLDREDVEERLWELAQTRSLVSGDDRYGGAEYILFEPGGETEAVVQGISDLTQSRCLLPNRDNFDDYGFILFTPGKKRGEAVRMDDDALDNGEYRLPGSLRRNVD